LKKDVGVEFVVSRIAVRSLNKKRLVKVPAKIFTTDPYEVVNDPAIDIVVELMGGTTKAFDLVTTALKSGKHVVTANKALLAERGDEIFALATKMKRWVFFEASVGGGIPIIKSIRESLIGNEIDAMHAIINGTSNYILSKMTAEKSDFKSALKSAQEKGYAEADPTFDINGMDAAHKLAILVRFGFGGKVKLKDIYCEGIQHIRSEDIAFAEEFGYRVKLLAIAKRTKDGVEARVQPTLLPKDHMLANVNGSFNAILIHGNHVGDFLLYGRGAGSLPTASAVVSDLVDIAKRYDRLDIDSALPMRAHGKTFKVKQMPSIESRYYLRFSVKDEAGVLSQIAKILGDHRISISDCVQKERNLGNLVSLIVLTHDAHEKEVRAAIRLIDRMKQVRGKSQVIRIENSN
jgi:homoserine dehydrogenase